MTLNLDIQKRINETFLWLKTQTTSRQIDEDWTVITTPFLDRHNDCLQIYVKKDNGEYFLTDDGYTISDLDNSGLVLDQQDLLQERISGFGGVCLEDDQLTIRTSEEDFPRKQFNLIQAMLAIIWSA